MYAIEWIALAKSFVYPHPTCCGVLYFLLHWTRRHSNFDDISVDHGICTRRTWDLPESKFFVLETHQEIVKDRRELFVKRVEDIQVAPLLLVEKAEMEIDNQGINLVEQR